MVDWTQIYDILTPDVYVLFLLEINLVFYYARRVAVCYALAGSVCPVGAITRAVRYGIAVVVLAVWQRLFDQ